MAWVNFAAEGTAPQARAGHTITWVEKQGACLMMGGASRTLSTYSDLWQLKEDNGNYEWIKLELQTMPHQQLPDKCRAPPMSSITARAHATATLVQDRLFLIGGFDAATGETYNDVAVLDVDTGQWSWPEVSGDILEPFHSHSATLLSDGRILIFGGSSEEGRTSNMSIFNTERMRWSKVSDHGDRPSAREMHSATAVGLNRIVFFGGRTEEGVSSDLLIFDAETMTWKQRRSTPFPSCAHSAVLVPGEGVLVYGGFSGKEVEGHVLRISPDSLEVEVISDAASSSATAELYGGAVPGHRFAHAATVVALAKSARAESPPPQAQSVPATNIPSRDGGLAGPTTMEVEEAAEVLLLLRQGAQRGASDAEVEGRDQEGAGGGTGGGTGGASPEADGAVTCTSKAGVGDMGDEVATSDERGSSNVRGGAEVVKGGEGEEEGGGGDEEEEEEEAAGGGGVVSAEALDLASVLADLSLSSGEDRVGGSDKTRSTPLERVVAANDESAPQWVMLVFGGATPLEDLKDLVVWDPQAQGCEPSDDASHVKFVLEEIVN